VDSFTCYWQIDYINKEREFGVFPIVDNVIIQIQGQDDKEEQNEGQNLRKPFKLPSQFFKPTMVKEKDTKVIEMKSYSFFMPGTYQRNKDKQTEFQDKFNKDNIITIGVKDPQPIDFLDKMSDKERDLKVMCESIADDFLKNMEAGNND